ncbi:hypothetical protein G9A89_010610 [Geosiphon pyriformis]|nr:hypothetical protein G9A89_010610 [Geosiphon pyriformis]
MRFFSNFNLFAFVAIAGSLLFTSTTNACEKSCQEGISQAFADKYVLVSTQLWSQNLYQQIQTKFIPDFNLLTYIPQPDALIIQENITKDLITNAQTLEINFEKSLPAIILRSIFKQEPKFKGDCNTPFRVKQPKYPDIWTLEDCVKMDYICGNPPSICHFLNDIKKRNVENVITALKTPVQNETWVNTLSLAVKNSVANNIPALANDQVKLSQIESNVKSGLKTLLNNFFTSFNNSFCAGTSCDEYDTEIKTKLLTYP